jgi:hypothetical protein
LLAVTEEVKVEEEVNAPRDVLELVDVFEAFVLEVLVPAKPDVLSELGLDQALFDVDAVQFKGENGLKIDPCQNQREKTIKDAKYTSACVQGEGRSITIRECIVPLKDTIAVKRENC